MRLRTTPHTPSPSSNVYPCGQRSIHLLRGYGFGYDQLMAEVRAGIEGRLAELEAGTITAALYTFALWDDPDLEWASQLDPNEVLDLHGAELIGAGRMLARELFGPASARLGLDTELLVQSVLPFAIYGLPKPDEPVGNAEPLPTLS